MEGISFIQSSETIKTMIQRRKGVSNVSKILNCPAYANELVAHASPCMRPLARAAWGQSFSIDHGTGKIK